MTSAHTLIDSLKARFGDSIESADAYVGEVTAELNKDKYVADKDS